MAVNKKATIKVTVPVIDIDAVRKNIARLERELKKYIEENSRLRWQVESLTKVATYLNLRIEELTPRFVKKKWWKIW
jgi:regulator of replication initiation timing